MHGLQCIQPALEELVQLVLTAERQDVTVDPFREEPRGTAESAGNRGELHANLDLLTLVLFLINLYNLFRNYSDQLFNMLKTL